MDYRSKKELTGQVRLVGFPGADLCACLDAPVTIAPGETAMIPLGLTCQPTRRDVALLVYPRSGLASKHGITLANAVGVVDSDYRGEICVGLCNVSDTPYTIEPGERVAQMVIAPVLTLSVVEIGELGETERGSGGFGSTGR